MKLARSVAKKTIASAISSAVAGRPAWAWAASCSRPSPIATVPSVRVGPGLTALTRTPSVRIHVIFPLTEDVYVLRRGDYPKIYLGRFADHDRTELDALWPARESL